MMNNIITISVKVDHDGCLRRFHFDFDKSASVNGFDHYDAFSKKLNQMLHLEPGTYKFLYRDSDGDFVVIDSDEEFKEALVNLSNCKTFNLLGFAQSTYLMNSSPVFTINMNAKIVMKKSNTKSSQSPPSNAPSAGASVHPIDCSNLLNPDSIGNIINSVLQGMNLGSSNSQPSQSPPMNPPRVGVNIQPLNGSNLLNPDSINNIINSVLQDTNISSFLQDPNVISQCASIVTPIVATAQMSTANFGSSSAQPAPQPTAAAQNTTQTTAQPAPATKPAVPEETYNASQYLARFIDDVTIPDYTSIEAGESFIKTWRIVNKSSFTWPKGTTLRYVGGKQMGPEKICVSGVKPGEEKDISIQLTAPNTSGTVHTHYRFCTPEGIEFGHKVWCTIKVPSESIKQYEDKSVPLDVATEVVEQEAAETVESKSQNEDSIKDSTEVASVHEEEQIDDKTNEENKDQVVNESEDNKSNEASSNDSERRASESNYPSQIYYPRECPSHPQKSWMSKYKTIVNNMFEQSNPSPPPRQELTEEELKGKIADLEAMGFTDTERITQLLKAYNGDVNGVVESLLQ